MHNQPNPLFQDSAGYDRRGFLRCMAWAGNAVLWTIRGGVARSQVLHPGSTSMPESFSFVQISDSHIGFSKEANPDVAGTLREAVSRINGLSASPDLLLHTGDVTHLSKPGEFDLAASILQEARAGQSLYVPGEHDVLGDNGKLFRERLGKPGAGDGWYSLDHKGVHFVALVNVLNLKAGGLGSLGADQLAWLAADLKGLASSTPVVVFAHVPLWTVYEAWGWGTEDGMQALELMKRFGSVSILNGHIHQTVQKVEGNLTFHTACSTAFPQPRPGMAPSPGPLKVAAAELRRSLGLTEVRFTASESPLAIVDSTLEAAPAQSSRLQVDIENVSFTPSRLEVAAGSTVTWLNRDDLPHNVVAADRSFSSPVLDTGERFTRRFDQPAAIDYFCSLHPKMTARLLVKAAAVVLLFAAAFGRPAKAQNRYAVRNLVSDVPGVAEQTDPLLSNPWGIAASSTSPFWISDNRSGTATVYNSTGQPFPAANPLVVRVPRGNVTGQVFNDTAGFELAPGKPAVFLFATEDGVISGWNPGVDPANAVVMADQSGSGAVYKGLAIAETENGPMLYAANFASGAIDVFDSTFRPAAAPGKFKAFNDAPAGFAPFNIQRIGKKLFVAYALQDDDAHDDVPGPGHGYVNIFDTSGYLLAYLISGGPLNSPWGIALAPENFGEFSHSLLVANFGDGSINAFDPCGGEFLGTLRDGDKEPIRIPGLWGLRFGNGRNGGDASTLYFTAGIPGPDGAIEDHRLFGGISVAPAQ